VIYRLLGELRVEDKGGGLLELPGGTALIVLAALLVHVNRRISKVDLIRAGWGVDTVDETQLYKRIKTIRSLLGQAGQADSLKTHARFGYELQAAETDVDMLAFLRLVREAEQAGLSGRGGDETGFLRQALSQWQGPRPLANVPTGAFAEEAEKLVQRHKRAAARLFDLEFSAGRYERILDEVIRVAGFYPDDRRLCELLMLTAHRCGHLADVHRAYDRYYRAIGQEAGGVPDTALRNLNYAIAQGETKAVVAAEAVVARRAGTSVAVISPVVATPRQLPPAAALVGRDYLAAEAKWLLGREPGAAAPVVVISGAGGTGKTALARWAAHAVSQHYPDGQLYVELRGSTGGGATTSEILAQFLRALNAPDIPGSQAERLAAYRTLLAGRRVLIVLDDAASGAQVADLVPASPACAVLVTARQRLPEIDGAHHMAPLGRLDDTAATELFLQVMIEAGIAPDQDLDAVAQVVRLCGGLPLALRIAGALRVHDHPRPTRALATRLARQGVAGLTYGELDVGAAIGAGFERLDPVAQRLFLGLGLLPLASFGPWAAALLDDQEAGSEAALSELAARFLIEPAAPGVRYQLHDLTRQYAHQRALAAYPGDADAVPALAYRALLTLARRAHAKLYGGDYEVVHSDVPDWDAPAAVLAEVDADPLAWFEAERASLHTAVQHCATLGLASLCWDLAVSAHEFYTIRGYFDDWHTTHTIALEACQAAGDQRGEGVVLTFLNQPALAGSRRPGGGPADLDGLRRAGDLLAAAGDRHGQAIALRTLANALRRQGHLTQPLALFTEALAHYEASGDLVGRWQTLRYLGQNHLYLGDHIEARRLLGEAETAAADLGSPRLTALTRYWTGQACLAAGDLDGAQAAFAEVLAAYGEDSSTGRAYARHGLGNVATRRHAWDEADAHFTEAAELAHTWGDATLEGRVWLSVASLREATGQPREQVQALRQAAAVFASCGAAYYETRALTALAQTLEAQGNDAAADAAWLRIEDLYSTASVPDEDRFRRRPDV